MSPSRATVNIGAPPGIGYPAVLVFALLLAATPGRPLLAGPPPKSAEIVSLEGKGDFRADGAQAWSAARVKQELYPGQFVRTGELSRMGLSFLDQSQIRINQNTLLQIKEVAAPGTDRQTVLGLLSGQAWSQAKSASRGVRIQTPSATAAIRGTDWELRVDDEGRSTLTVLSGEVDFFNDFGRLTVASNEQATAEIGKAPVKLLITNPRDRIQWVTAYAVDPLRFITRPAAQAADVRGSEVAALDQIAALIQGQQFKEALTRLEAMAPQATQAAPYLLLADLMIYSGDTARALAYATEGLARFPRDARLHSERALAYLLADRLGDSAAEVQAALAVDARSVDAHIALGDLARQQGKASDARAAYLAALALNPSEPGAWYGLGVIHNERQDLRRGRTELRRALALNPSGPGYGGELGTLETFANRLDAAAAEYARALELNPDDYIALTGQGLLELKRGHAEAALEILMHASLLEPRYARVHMYLAVACYRLGRSQQAREELGRASELDPKDPFPHLLSSIIDSDLFDPARAIESGRTAMRLMPFLKSLNQLANNQKGTANLGNAFAFFGLEDWALTLAQESYYPYWAGSHLFLGDRYPGLFDKNSEYFQGLLADPTVFGASPRFQSLLPKPGAYVTTGVRSGTDRHFYAAQPYVTANGLVYLPTPAAYFLDVEQTRVVPRTPSLDATARSVVGAIGATPSPELGFFAYARDERGHATVIDPSQGLQNSPLNFGDRRIDLGAHYQFSPQSTVWLKAGHGSDETTLKGLFDGANLHLSGRESSNDLQLRHTVAAGHAHELTWGAETSYRQKILHLDLDSTAEPGSLVVDQTVDDRSLLLYGSDRLAIGTKLLLQGDVVIQRYQRRVHNNVSASDETGIEPGESVETVTSTHVSPRAGFVYRFGDQRLLRFTYQSFVRPIAVSTLGPVATAGIPLSDRFTQSGGASSRVHAQVEWAWTPTTFTTGWYARETVKNLALSDGIEQAPSELGLQKIRNQILVNPAAVDLLEETPVFGRGTVTWRGVTLSQLVGRQFSLYSRYMFASSKNTGDELRGNVLPLIPRHLVVFGVTWVSPLRFYVTGQAVHRSRRFKDEGNSQPSLRPDWHGTLKGYWELPSKRWSFEVAADHLFSGRDPVSFTADVKFRY